MSALRIQVMAITPEGFHLIADLSVVRHLPSMREATSYALVGEALDRPPGSKDLDKILELVERQLAAIKDVAAQNRSLRKALSNPLAAFKPNE